MQQIFSEVGKKFGISGEVHSYEIITNGRINGTYKVTYVQPDGVLTPYIVQRVNTNVFKAPELVMENIDIVTTYLREKFPDQLSLCFFRTDEGLNYYVSADGGFWRVMNYVEALNINKCEYLEDVENTGVAFGRFQNQLADIDGASLNETIPDFHNTRKRIETFFADVEKDICGRASEIGDEIEYLLAVREKASVLSDRLAGGELPTRVTHNDTKSNNALFDKQTREPLLVIDLDTVMPGSAVYDFGDAIRFIANTAGEGETDLSNVKIDVDKFRAFTQGFLGQTYSALEKSEVEALVLGAFTMTVELAVRFLDDYVVGDTYFGCRYPKHNLDRGRCQLQLARDIEKKWNQLERVVLEVVDDIRGR